MIKNRKAVISYALLLIVLMFILLPLVPTNGCPSETRCYFAQYVESTSYYLFGFGSFVNNFGQFGLGVPGLGTALFSV